jgi:hypothetical protein
VGIVQAVGSVRVGCTYSKGRGERSGSHAFQLRYEIGPASGLLVELA